MSETNVEGNLEAPLHGQGLNMRTPFRESDNPLIRLPTRAALTVWLALEYLMRVSIRAITAVWIIIDPPSLAGHCCSIDTWFALGFLLLLHWASIWFTFLLEMNSIWHAFLVQVLRFSV
jgi:hypothetical protein